MVYGNNSPQGIAAIIRNYFLNISFCLVFINKEKIACQHFSNLIFGWVGCNSAVSVYVIKGNFLKRTQNRVMGQSADDMTDGDPRRLMRKPRGRAAQHLSRATNCSQ